MTGVPESNSQLLLLVNLFTVLTLHTISSVVIDLDEWRSEVDDYRFKKRDGG